ncbi:MAG: exodeoxyribonuclease I [Candidatus Saccharimonadales bacterium]
MAASFFFYDLETSGINPRTARIMQFAGQRTDMDLKPIGEPVNSFIKLTPDILPDADAILLTGITPQQTLSEGVSEAAFLKQFYEEVVKPDTIFVGFNSIRFDDEFMRFLHWRNFYDAYEWQWQNGCSKWDLLDVVRMTRALRPEGIKWGFGSDGGPSNRLEVLTSVNKLKHANAHDALGDVNATIEVAKLINKKQPDLFKYLLNIRSKKAVAELVNSYKPLVYTSGHFSSDFLHTSPVVKFADHPGSEAALVYDLKFDPTPYFSMSIEKLIDAWRYSPDKLVLRLPVKTLKYNRCPAVAPLGVINSKEIEDRLHISKPDINKHHKILKENQTHFAEKIFQVLKVLDEERENEQADLIDNPLTVDERLYEDFVPTSDRNLMRAIQTSGPDEIYEIGSNFQDKRLINLLPLYKARNFPKSLDPEEQLAWETYRKAKLLSGGNQSRAAVYFALLEERLTTNPSKQKQYLIEELRLYGESILPVDVAD